MRILHDYNYDDLETVELDFYRDVSMFQLLFRSVSSSGDVLDDGSLCLFHDLSDLFRQHLDSFQSVLSRISRDAVPPEGEEPFEACFYPKIECLPPFGG